MNHTQHSRFAPLLLLLLFCLLFASQNAQAQFRVTDSSKKEKKGKKEETPFLDRLWYGGGVNIGFSGFNGSSAFGFGVSPMVGYKFNNWLSAGPRLSIFFTSQKIQGYKAINLFNTEAGVFVRARVFKGFFLQGEVGNQWVQEPYELLPNNTISKITIQRFAQYIGAGYNFSNGEGGPGSEIGIFHNFAIANDINAYQSPWDYRFAFTFRF